MLMTDLASLDLEVYAGAVTHVGEKRLELRTVSTKKFTAWFRSDTRISDGVPVSGTSTQLVRHKELTDEQVAAAKEWLREQLLEFIREFLRK